MKPREEYQRTIEYFVPIAECPADPDESWYYTLAIFHDVYAAYPDAGITVTRCGRKEPQVRRLVLHGEGLDRAAIQRLLEESERAHKHS